MAPSPSQVVAEILAKASPLPFDDVLWQKIVQKLGLSDRQASVMKLMLCDLSDSQIALVLGISESTVEAHQQRIRYWTGKRSRMQLAMHVVAVAHEVD